MTNYFDDGRNEMVNIGKMGLDIKHIVSLVSWRKTASLLKNKAADIISKDNE